MSGSTRALPCIVAALLPLAVAGSKPRDGQHDFDFEIGVWETRLKRLVHPLSGSATWVAYAGTTTVRKVWNGRANLVELEVDGPQGHIEGLSLRLYNPDAHQRSLNYPREGVAGVLLFYRHHCVGSESWSSDGICRADP